MSDVAKPFPEMGASTDPKQVPWADAVVWSERMDAGQKVYEWLTKEHVRQVSWTSGMVSIELSPESFLSKDSMYFLVRAPFVTIGKNMPVG